MVYRCVLIEDGKTTFIKDNLTYEEMIVLWGEHRKKEHFKTYSKENEDTMLELDYEYKFGKCIYFCGKHKSLADYDKEAEEDANRRKEWNKNINNFLQFFNTEISPLRKNQNIYSLLTDIENGEDISKPKVL